MAALSAACASGDCRRACRRPSQQSSNNDAWSVKGLLGTDIGLGVDECGTSAVALHDNLQVMLEGTRAQDKHG
eukprot:1143893-Pelagomonas_calceolata.AAC.2